MIQNRSSVESTIIIVFLNTLESLGLNVIIFYVFYIIKAKCSKWIQEKRDDLCDSKQEEEGRKQQEGKDQKA